MLAVYIHDGDHIQKLWISDKSVAGLMYYLEAGEA